MTDASSGDTLSTKALNLVGREFANYRIISELGRGGMAIVYKADELSLNRVVALKVMSPKLSEDEMMIKRFVREAQAAAKLSHPNIIHIYAIGEQDGVHFFTMEYVKGRTLKDMRKESGRLRVDEAIPLMIQTAEALGEAHKAGLVHRDIKPSNIMVDAAGRAKVADFGIARVAEATTQLTVDGAFLGTPQYMSPEQCEGKNVDGRSDIYSLGVTFYEMLTGQMPYDAETPASILVKIMKGEFRPIREIAPLVPEPVQAVIAKMLNVNREQRYRDAAELITALKQLETGSAVDSTSATLAMATLAASAAAVPRPSDPAPASVAGAIEPVGALPQPGSRERKNLAIGVAAVVVLALIATVLAFGIVGGKFGRNPRPVSLAALPEPVSPAATENKTVSPALPSAAQENGAMPPAVAAKEPAPALPPGHGMPVPAGQPTPAVQPAASRPNPAAPAAVGAGTATPAVQPTPAIATPGHGDNEMPATASNPDEDTIMVTSTGGDDKAALAVAEAELALTEQGLVVIDRGSAEGKKPADVAAMNMIISFTQTGTTELKYMDRTTEQYSMAISMKVVECAGGKMKAGPVSTTVQFTALTAQKTLADAGRRLAEDLCQQINPREPAPDEPPANP